MSLDQTAGRIFQPFDFDFRVGSDTYATSELTPRIVTQAYDRRLTLAAAGQANSIRQFRGTALDAVQAETPMGPTKLGRLVNGFCTFDIVITGTVEIAFDLELEFAGARVSLNQFDNPSGFSRAQTFQGGGSFNSRFGLVSSYDNLASTVTPVLQIRNLDNAASIVQGRFTGWVVSGDFS